MLKCLKQAKPENCQKYWRQSIPTPNTGCLPSPKDKRDYNLTRAMPLTTDLPFAITLPYSPVKNQWITNSCVGFAITAAYETLRIIHQRENYPIDTSESFVYWNARKSHDAEKQDSGTFIRAALKSAQEEGIALENFWSFNTSNINTKPSWLAYATARAMRIGTYYGVTGEWEIHNSLAKQMPVIAAVKIRPSFLRGEKPREAEKYNEGLLHAILIIGYNDDEEYYVIKNSWGSTWGKEGIYHYPYWAFEKDMVEAWSVSI